MKYLLPTLIVLPVLEIFTLIEVGSYIGTFYTIGLVLLTAVVGVALLRLQGFRALADARMKLLNAEIPTEEMLTGFFLALGGVLLITPGFITDLFGFVCLIPFSRRILFRLLNLSFFSFTRFASQTENVEKDWIEGEYKRNK